MPLPHINIRMISFVITMFHCVLTIHQHANPMLYCTTILIVLKKNSIVITQCSFLHHNAPLWHRSTTYFTVSSYCSIILLSCDITIICFPTTMLTFRKQYSIVQSHFVLYDFITPLYHNTPNSTIMVNYFITFTFSITIWLHNMPCGHHNVPFCFRNVPLWY